MESDPVSHLAIIAVAVGIAMDAFAVSVAASVSLRHVSPRQVFRFAFHFGLFQAMMPVIGWAAGCTIHEYVEMWGHWIAFGLLALIGGKAILESFNDDRDDGEGSDPTRGFSLVFLSTATSIDAMAVGVSFAMLGVEIWYPCAIIGVVTSALTVIGMLVGARLGDRFGRRIEVVGGLVLIGIGVKILLEHVL